MMHGQSFPEITFRHTRPSVGGERWMRRLFKTSNFLRFFSCDFRGDGGGIVITLECSLVEKIAAHPDN